MLSMLSSKSPDLLLLFYEKDILSIDYQTKNLILYTNVSVDAYIYVLVGHVIELDKNKADVQKQEKKIL